MTLRKKDVPLVLFSKMNVKIETWPFDKIIKSEPKIDPKPQYQRGNVWASKDNKLLVDSILQGFDIPKIYLRRSTPESMFEYEVADGQQRLFAIWKFSKNEVRIEEIEVNGVTYENLTFEALKNEPDYNELYAKLKNTKFTISILEEASDKEVRTLFARLQMGKPLNEPEKRNAVGSAIGYAIDLEVETCEFFKNSKIPRSRFNQQDYLAHAITLIHNKNESDLKAEGIKKTYEDLYIKFPMTYMQNAHKILGWLHQLNINTSCKIKNKWAFVDFFWLFYRHFKNISSIDYTKMGKAFLLFEYNRLKYSKKPEILIETDDDRVYDKDLYEYIIAFNFSGNSTYNITTRAKVLDNKFLKFVTFK